MRIVYHNGSIQDKEGYSSISGGDSYVCSASNKNGIFCPFTGDGYA